MRLLALIIHAAGRSVKRCGVLLSVALLLYLLLPGRAGVSGAGYASGNGSSGPVTTARSSAPGRSEESPLCSMGPAVDLCATFGAVLQAIFIAPLEAAVSQFIQALVSLVWTTPRELSYDNTAIQGLWRITLLIADGLVLLALSIAGIRLIWERNILAYVDVLETLPQVVLAVFLAHMSRYMVAGLIELNNALIQAFLSRGEPVLTTLYLAGRSPANPLAQALVVLLGAFISLLILQQVVRLIVVNLGFVLAAAGCFCLAYKPFQALGRFWLSTFLAAVFAQLLQVIILDIGLLLLTSITAKLSIFSVNVLLGIGTVYIALVVPGYLYRWAMQPVVSAARQVAGAGEAALNVAGTAARAAGARV
jgi:hypothetical protein